MTKLEQIVQEIRTSIVNTAEQAEERIESLRKKYGDLDLKDYRVRAYAHGRTLIFDIDEKDLPRFIRDFRVHFGHKGEVSSVWHSWEKTFSVTYRFDEDFEAKQFIDDIIDTYGDDARIVSVEGEEYFGYPEYGGLAGTLIDYVIHYREEL